MYISLAKSKHPEKALHISLLALAGTIQRLHIAHYARGGIFAPTAADIEVWIDGAGAGAARIQPDAELTTILLRLVAAVNASCQRCKITEAAEKTQHRLSLMIDANQLLTLSLIEGCSKHACCFAMSLRCQLLCATAKLLALCQFKQSLVLKCSL